MFQQSSTEVTKACELLSDEAVLQRFIDLFNNKEKREAFERDPQNIQKQYVLFFLLLSQIQGFFLPLFNPATKRFSIPAAKKKGYARS